MSNKYIIKNCPAFNDIPNMYGEVYGYCDNEHDIDLNKCMCENITDCVMKQIVELAKGHTELCKNCDQQIKECDCSDICNAYRLDKILKLLDIQEVE